MLFQKLIKSNFGKKYSLFKNISDSKMHFIDTKKELIDDKPNFSLYFSETSIPKLKPNELLLKVKATGINRAEILQKKGLYPPPPNTSEIIGQEAVGSIVDPETLVEINQGELVGGILPGGGYGQYTAIGKDSLLKFPKNMALDECAAIPEAWQTAFQLLHIVARIQEGEWVYVPAAASGVGLAAIQLIKNCFKGKVIASCGTQEKVDFVKKCGADLVINYKEPGMSHEKMSEIILEATKGVDIIQDCVGPTQFPLYSNILNLDSRWVQYGLLGGMKIEETKNFGRVILSKRVSILGTTLRMRDTHYKANLIQNFNELVMSGFENGLYKPIIYKKFLIDFSNKADEQKVNESHRIMESDENIGKLILEFHKS